MQMLRSKWTGRVYNGNKREKIVLADPLIRRIYSVMGRQRARFGSQWLLDRKKCLCYSCQKAAKAQPVSAAKGILATPVGQRGALGVCCCLSTSGSKFLAVRKTRKR
jgi:hypothetical protein